MTFLSEEEEKVIFSLISENASEVVFSDDFFSASILEDTIKKPYLCPQCGKMLSGLTSFRRHLLIHSGERPFACQTCGKSFTQAQRLKTHERIHTGERPYACHMCTKAFTESCKLKRHLDRVHHIVKGI